ncbi:MAG: MATE family efflux transporter [Firmicutes bacterium]|nr:MATE family efflux transporter [Bacillota bacterium]
MMVTPDELRNESVVRLILKFAGPAIAGMLMMSIYNVTDRIFIGHAVGPLALAGLAVAFPLMMIKGALGILIGLGGSSLLSIRMGEGREEEARFILGNSFTLVFFAGIISSVIALLFLRPLLAFMGASEAVMQYAYPYTLIILFGNPFHLIGLSGTNLIRAEGSPRASMLTNFIGACTNIVLDAIFVLGFRWGVSGAAIATVISQIASSIWVIMHFVRGKGVLQVAKKHLKVSWERALEIAKIGLAPFSRSIVNSSIVILFNNSLKTYGGDIAVSAMGVIFSVDSLLIMPLVGLSNGAQPVLGFNYGARQYDRVKKALFYAIGIATTIVIIIYLVIMLAPGFILRLFTSDQELIRVATEGMRLYMLLLPVVGAQMIGSNYFLATGRSGQAIFLNLARQCIFLVPLLLILPRYLDLAGVWLSQSMADALAFITTTSFVLWDIRRLNRQQKLMEAEN